MKGTLKMRYLLAFAAFAALATPALADTTTGTIVAFDRVANVIVMEDKTIWQLSADTVVPEGLLAGDSITITFTSLGDDGVKSVDKLEKM
jgi:hypothetical protein